MKKRRTIVLDWEIEKKPQIAGRVNLHIKQISKLFIINQRYIEEKSLTQSHQMSSSIF